MKNIKIIKLARYLNSNGYSKEYKFLRKIAQSILNYNWYEVLGVPQDATENQIRKAFTRLSMEFHPDKVRGNPELYEEYLNKQRVLGEAKATLTNQEQRALFDRFLSEGKVGAAQAAEQSAASGAASAAMSAEELANTLRNIRSPKTAEKIINRFIASKPNLTAAEISELRNAINGNQNLLSEAGNLKGNLRNLNPKLWDEVSAAAKQAAEGAAAGARMSASEMALTLSKIRDPAAAKSLITEFVNARPNLTAADMTKLRSAIDANTELIGRVRGDLKASIRSLNPELWESAKGSAGAAEGAAAGGSRGASSAGAAAGEAGAVARGEAGAVARNIAQSGRGEIAALSNAGRGAAAETTAISRVVANPANLSRLAMAGSIIKGVLGFAIIDIGGKMLIDIAMSEAVRDGWSYNVNLSSSFTDVAGYRVVGGIGSVVDDSGKPVQTSTIDRVKNSEILKVGQPFSGKGSPQPESRTFAPGGVVIEIVLARNAGSVMAVFKATPDANSATVTADITDAMIKEAYSKAIGGDKELQQALSSGSLGEIAEKQMKKVEADKETAKAGFGVGTTIGFAAAGGAGSQAAGAALTAGGLAGAGAIVGVGFAGFTGWQLGTAINKSLEARDIVIGRGTETFFRNLGRPATQWKYVVGLEQTEFVKKNVKEFNIALATGKLYEKAGLFTPGKTGALTSDSYDESMSNAKYSPATQTLEVAGAGGYKNDGIFSPEKILVNIVFNDGKSISLYSPILINAEEGKRGCTVKEADIIARYNKKYPQSAVKGQQPAQQQKPYTNLEGRSVAVKAYMLDVATKLGIANGYTSADVAIGSWDKKSDDLMVNVVNNTFTKVLSPQVAKKVSGQLGPGKSWKWSAIAPQIGYPPNLNGAIKYFQDLNSKLLAGNS